MSLWASKRTQYGKYGEGRAIDVNRGCVTLAEAATSSYLLLCADCAGTSCQPATLAAPNLLLPTLMLARANRLPAIAMSTPPVGTGGVDYSTSGILLKHP